MPKISIHLVTWNGQKYIEECLKAILKQTFMDYFLLVIDNGSFDQTVKIIEQEFVPVFGPKIRFIKNKENIGFAKAHNQALLWTDSEYVLALNQDVILADNFLLEMVKFLDAHKNVGSATGKVLRWKMEQTEYLKNSEKSDIVDSLGLQIFKSQRVVDLAAGEADNGQFDQEKEIFGVSASCPVYRRVALQDIRYKDEFFDNDFFSYKEDVDLAYRLRWRGWSSFYVPAAVAYHERTVKGGPGNKVLKIISQRKNKSKFVNYHSYKNHLFILLKNLSSGNFLRYFSQIFFYELGKFLYILFLETSTLSGCKEFFRKFKKMKGKRKFIMGNRLITDEKMRDWFV